MRVELHILGIEDVALLVKLMVGLLKGLDLLVAMADLSLVFTDSLLELAINFDQLIDLFECLLIATLQSIIGDVG